MSSDKIIRFGGGAEELPEDLREMEQILLRAADLEQFDAAEQELDEADLELIAAAGPATPYQCFVDKLRKAENKKEPEQ